MPFKLRLATLMAIAFSLFSFISVAQVKKPVTGKSKTVQAQKKQPQSVTAKSAVKKLTGTRIKITTDSGVIVVRLYDSTPLHRNNFIRLVKEGFYDSLLFHRVIPEFMIQGGDPTGKYAAAGTLIGNGGSNMERIPAEITPLYFHKKGALAAARDENPEKKSSACQFYIVEGKKLSANEMTMVEQRTGRKYTQGEKMVYETIGGTPWLDGAYTVFGETESGLEVIDKIANMPRDNNNRPLTDIRMKMEIL